MTAQPVVPLMSTPAFDTEGFFSLQQDGALLRRSILPGGIRVLTETIPAVRSAAIGAWVAVGSRDENEEHAGSTHFLEHLLFKGTPSRSAYEISAAFDEVGGEANASTAKNYTCYYARVLDADLPMASATIMDMVTSSILDPADFEMERNVILEELAMAADDPADVVHEAFTATVLAGHPLGRPIGGTPEAIRRLGRDAVVEHYRNTYVPSGLVITAAGNVDHEAVCAMVLDAAHTARWVLDPAGAPTPRRSATSAVYAPPTTLTIFKPIEQAHVIVGGRGTATSDPRRFALTVASTVLGGGMSSRLFQEIREKRGLAYATYSFTAGYQEGGIFGSYAACSPARTAEVIEVLQAQTELLADQLVPEAELRRAVGQICGSFVLGSEDTGARMSRLGIAEVVTGELVSFEETLRRYRAVTAEDVRAVARDLLSQPPSVVVVGPQPACEQASGRR